MIEFKVGSYYFVKRGYNDRQPSGVVKIVKVPEEVELSINGIRIADGVKVFIIRERFVKEVTKETNPEYYL